MLHGHFGCFRHNGIDVLFHLRDFDILNALDSWFESFSDLFLIVLIRSVIREQIKAVELLNVLLCNILCVTDFGITS